MANNIECEIRSFITKEQYKKLLGFFNKDGKSLEKENQITYYFDGDADLRIQQNKAYSKIWLKKGRIHDEAREEIEIRCAKGDFKKLEKLFLILGYKIEIKWFRQRNSFKWKGINVCLDYTRGYGYIIELEKMRREKEIEKTRKYLKLRLAELEIPLTPKKEFEKAYDFYKKNWRKLTGGKSRQDKLSFIK